MKKHKYIFFYFLHWQIFVSLLVTEDINALKVNKKLFVSCEVLKIQYVFALLHTQYRSSQ